MTSLPPLIDVDCNLWHKDLQEPLLPSGNTTSTTTSPLHLLTEDAVRETNIVAVVSPSSTLAEAKRGLFLLIQQQQQQQPRLSEAAATTTTAAIRTTVGIHPYHVNDDDAPSSIDAGVEEMNMLVLEDEEKKESQQQRFIAAIGECGLDASDGFPPLASQIPWFRAQARLAQERNMPLFVHERLAFAETMEILKDISVPILIHCFTGTRQECQAYVKRGYSLSVSGFICKQDVGSEVRACLEEGLIPLDRLMIETDAPYMGFEGCRVNLLEKHADAVASLNAKKRKRLQKGLYPNVPSSLPLVLDQVVESLNFGREKRGEEKLQRVEVARQTTANAVNFFGFDDIEM